MTAAGFALFWKDKQISKTHLHEKAAEIEAYERGLIVTGRFNRGKGIQNVLADGYKIKPVGNL